MPMSIPIVETEEPHTRRNTGFNESVPSGHRAKCGKCGAMDTVIYGGFDRSRGLCGACGSKISRRRAPVAPKIVSFMLVRQLDGISYRDNKSQEYYVECVDLFTAEAEALKFVEKGPVGRSRVAMVVELLDGGKTANGRVLKYENYKCKYVKVIWEHGCKACKGRGLIAIRIPVMDKSEIRYVNCEACNGLGGELTRMAWSR